MAVALWFVPQASSNTYVALQSLILSLQTLFPDAPSFEPHLTVTSQLKCETREQAHEILAACVAAVEAVRGAVGRGGDATSQDLVAFSGVGIGKSYFRKVRLECVANKYLVSVAQLMRELFVCDSAEQASHWAVREFAPHVSLVYSDVYHVNQAVRRVLVQRIEDALDGELRPCAAVADGDDAAWLCARQLRGWGLPGQFKVVRCEGGVAEWQVLASVEV
ncbi:LAMI_0E00738g1_1 [Lachancea mirantina]|uniref:2',3'-cyclic-nucleotide 3'-phosphodiesterase n=1 Tax=Lachancea mirantina TaxID=1230905 RepID=A0A1G4JI81_9SACH|nr:LAMI_0E00738g1_1 [Lachancea mirantina]